MFIRYILSIVCLKLYRFCHSSVMQYVWGCITGAACIQLIHFSCDDCENTCISSYYHHQIGSMAHLRLCRVRSWNNGMCYVSFYVLVFFFIVICRHNSKIEDFEDAVINLSKLELSQLHTRTSKVSHNIHQVFGIIPMSDSNWHKAVVSHIV